MRIAIMGSGALGGFFGGLLARAGEDVTFIARGAHLAAIRTRGLTIKSEAVGDFTISAPATDDPRTIGSVDLVLVGVKTYDLGLAAEQIRPLVGPDTLVLPLENGIQASDRLAQSLGQEPVLTGVAYVLSSLQAPGVVKHIAQGRLLLGEPSGGPSPRVRRLAEALQGAGIACETPPDIRVPLWEKFILLSATGGAMALTRLPFGPVRESAEAGEFCRGVMDETEAVGRASGIGVPRDIAGRHWQMILGLPAAGHGSMLQDLKAGRRLELESLNGAVVRLGRELGVPTPLNFAIYAALKPYVNGPPAMPA
jgi:2-dehydropantoate 2-reductase